MDVNDEPPMYEPPPSYEEVMKKEKDQMAGPGSSLLSLNGASNVKLPDSPPPPYKVSDDLKAVAEEINAWAPFYDNIDGAGPSSSQTGKTLIETSSVMPKKPFDIRSFLGSVSCGIREECDCAGACSCASTRRGNISATWSPSTLHSNAVDSILENIQTQNHTPDSNDGKTCVKGSLSADNIFLSECI